MREGLQLCSLLLWSSNRCRCGVRPPYGDGAAAGEFKKKQVRFKKKKKNTEPYILFLPLLKSGLKFCKTFMIRPVWKIVFWKKEERQKEQLPWVMVKLLHVGHSEFLWTFCTTFSNLKWKQVLIGAELVLGVSTKVVGMDVSFLMPLVWRQKDW